MKIQGFNLTRPTGSVEKDNFYSPTTPSNEHVARHLTYNIFAKTETSDLAENRKKQQPENNKK
jgi:hypothetical protein